MNSRAEDLRALLERMLAPIRRSRETPLRFEIDSAGIANAALIGFRPGDRGDSPPGAESAKPSLISALNGLIEQTLLPESTTPPGTSQAGDTSRQQTALPATPPSLAAWLDRLFNVMRQVDHRAFEILSLRLEGFEDRDIADRVGTGLRLVKRITRDMQSRWSEASER